MAEKILNTRIRLKYDSLANWTTSNTTLLEGEVAIAYLATSEMKDGTSGTQHPVLFKVGPGNFNDLPFASALAADVYGWAKKSEAEFTEWVNSIIEHPVDHTSVEAGDGIDITGSSANGSYIYTVSHEDTSSVTNLSAPSRTYVNSLTFDDF